MSLQWVLIGAALLLSAFQLCFSANLTEYEACSKYFKCDDISISYPFWGAGRPYYCGLSDLRLDCEGSLTKFNSYDDTYVVLNNTEANQILRVVRNDEYQACFPIPFSPTSFIMFSDDPFVDNNSPLQYAPDNQNLTLFYNCSSKPYQSAESICSYDMYNTTSKLNAYLSSESEPKEIMRDNSNCQGSTHIPVRPYDVHNEELNKVVREGFDVKYDAVYHSLCANCTESGGVCGTAKSYDVFHCYCHDGTSSETNCHLPGKSSMSGRKITFVVVSFFVFCIIVCTSLRKKISSAISVLFWKRSMKAQRVEDLLRTNGSIAPKRYNYSDIKKMTGSFKDKLGQGGFGGVFKGKLLDGRLVAVKVMRESKGDGEDFINEVTSISRTSHVNIVSLLGFCFEVSKRALIYEFMSNGSLEKFIYKDEPFEPISRLPWETLYQIIVGVSRGLEYLHRGCNTRILHFDIKPHNILLDNDFCPKISDFGLAKLCSNKESHVLMLDARGTAGYTAPEVFCRNFGGVSHKSDVYSFGMMVLEIVGGRKNINSLADRTSEIFFPNWIHTRIELNVDLGLCGIASERDIEITKKMILVGLWCVQTNPSDRPSMSKVVEMFEGPLESLQIPPKAFLYNSGSPNDFPTIAGSQISEANGC